MKSSPYSHITDELLSAYIDNAVTEAERALIEQALAADAEVAWRLETLRRTVQLVKQLPAVSLPRSFVLEERHLVEATVHRSPLSATEAATPTHTSWRAWLSQVGEAWWGFWQAGNLRLRNAAAASLALFLLLTTVGLWQQGGQGQQLALTPAQPTSAQRTARAAPEAMTAATVSTQASKAQAPDQPETGAVEAEAQMAPGQAESPAVAAEEGEAAPVSKAKPASENESQTESATESSTESSAVAMAVAPQADEGETAQATPEEAAAGAAGEGDVATVEAAAVSSPAQAEAATAPEAAPEATTPETTTESIVIASALPTNPPTSSRSLGPAAVEAAPPGGVGGGYGVGGGGDIGGGVVAPPSARGYEAPPVAAMAAPAVDVAALPPPPGPVPEGTVESALPVTTEITATVPITQTQALEVAPEDTGAAADTVEADTAEAEIDTVEEAEPAPAEAATPDASQAPTPVPTASPSPTPSPEPPAPTGAEPSGSMDTGAIEPATGSAAGPAGLWSRLLWLQVTAALLTVTLSALWWRSRGRS